MRPYNFDKAYRSESNNWGIPRNATAADVVLFEQEELGNNNNVNKKDINKLKTYPAWAVTWVCPKKKDAMYYGNPEKYPIPKGTKIIGEDEQGGYMVLLPVKSKDRLKKGEWAQRIVYHGKYENTETGKRFGGKHYGTKKAAEDRLRDILKTTSSFRGEPDAQTKLGKPVIKRYIFDDEKIFGKKEPLAEGKVTVDKSGDIRDMATVVSQIPQIRQELDKKGYKGIAYVNEVEDPGSISYLIWDKDLVREAKRPIPIEVTIGVARSVGSKVKKGVKNRMDDVHYGLYRMKTKAGKVR